MDNSKICDNCVFIYFLIISLIQELRDKHSKEQDHNLHNFTIFRLCMFGLGNSSCSDLETNYHCNIVFITFKVHN